MKFVITCCLLLTGSSFAIGQMLGKEALDTAHIYTSIEEAMKNPAHVYKLKLRDKLEKVPDEVKLFTNLNVLDLSKNRLTELPEFLIQMQYLQRLDISRNKFLVFPAQICRIISLKELVVNRNEMEGFPACIGNLVNLEFLDAWFTDISIFPEEMKKMTSLVEIDLRETRIREEMKPIVGAYFPNAKVHYSNGCNCAY